MINDDALNTMACICHEANKAICDHSGDHSQVHWNETPEWQKDSAIAGVKTVLSKPTITAKELHDTWVTKKINDGWLYGSVKDENKKTHPNLVDYEKLSDIDKLKDSVFLSICNSTRYFK